MEHLAHCVAEWRCIDMSISKAERLLSSWKGNPAKFVRECIGATPTKQQEGALEAIRSLVAAKILAFEKTRELTVEEREMSMKMGVSIMSGHGTGKDSLCAWMILWPFRRSAK